MYGIQGAGGIDIGPASVLGTRFGAYVDLMRDRISQHWNTASVHSLPSQKMRGQFYNCAKRHGNERASKSTQRRLSAGHVGEEGRSGCQSAASSAGAIRTQRCNRGTLVPTKTMMRNLIRKQ